MPCLRWIMRLLIFYYRFCCFRLKKDCCRLCCWRLLDGNSLLRNDYLGMSLLTLAVGVNTLTCTFRVGGCIIIR